MNKKKELYQPPVAIRLALQHPMNLLLDFSFQGGFDDITDEDNEWD